MAFCKLLFATDSKLQRSKYDFKPTLGIAFAGLTVSILNVVGDFGSYPAKLFYVSRPTVRRSFFSISLSEHHQCLTVMETSSVLHDI
jgi:hypothetical protein